MRSCPPRAELRAISNLYLGRIMDVITVSDGGRAAPKPMSPSSAQRFTEY